MISTHVGIMLSQEFHSVLSPGPYYFFFTLMIYLMIFPQFSSFWGWYVSFFSVVNNIHTSAATLKQDLGAITNRAFQWKMVFNSDLSKQAQEVIFSRKIKKLLHPALLFNNIPLSNSLFQKHLGLTLDVKLNFSEHIRSITKKI